MANPDIQLMGATYQAVSGVTLPVAGGGTATFPFVEGSQTITTNNTYDVTSLAQVIVNVAGGGGSGLTYETGTYTPAEDINKPTISFANSHNTRPFFAMIVDTDTSSIPSSSIMLTYIVNWYDLYGIIAPTGSDCYAYVAYCVPGSGASLSKITSLDSMPNHLTNEAYIPYGSSTRKFRSGRTYKWIAVWAPTT